MKILLICAGGLSTSMLMKKLEKYAAEKGINLEKIEAVSTASYRDVCQEYDVILLGPQVSYQKAAVTEGSGGMPVGAMAPYDYAIGNAENIFKLVDSLLQNKK
ncbi:MAG: PTS sugar transporter subunit IIB [Clostridia bacterium]|nr:PTS sugar transporter subunit IIB [Clostridia bacterium]